MGTTLGRILVVRGGAIGDFILTLPVLAALRQQFPQSHLSVLGYPHIAQLALAGGLADEVRSTEAGPLAGFFARDGTLNAALVEFFASFDIIISYLYDPDGIFRANVARCSKSQFIPGPHRPDEKAGLHATDVFLQPLERLAIFGADSAPRLNLASDLSLSKPGEASAGTLALHPGSGSERKNWPETKWAELLDQLIRTTAMQLLIVTGEAEEERLARLIKPLPDSRIQLARNVALSELAPRLAMCAGFVGHDSGITHLAAAVGLPVLVLWGDSAEAVWRPEGERVIILKDAKSLADLSVSEVLKQIAQLLRG